MTLIRNLSNIQELSNEKRIIKHSLGGLGATPKQLCFLALDPEDKRRKGKNRLSGIASSSSGGRGFVAENRSGFMAEHLAMDTCMTSSSQSGSLRLPRDSCLYPYNAPIVTFI